MSDEENPPDVPEAAASKDASRRKKKKKLKSGVRPPDAPLSSSAPAELGEERDWMAELVAEATDEVPHGASLPVLVEDIPPSSDDDAPPPPSGSAGPPPIPSFPGRGGPPPIPSFPGGSGGGGGPPPIPSFPGGGGPPPLPSFPSQAASSPNTPARSLSRTLTKSTSIKSGIATGGTLVRTLTASGEKTLIRGMSMVNAQSGGTQDWFYPGTRCESERILHLLGVGRYLVRPFLQSGNLALCILHEDGSVSHNLMQKTPLGWICYFADGHITPPFPSAIPLLKSLYGTYLNQPQPGAMAPAALAPDHLILRFYLDTNTLRSSVLPAIAHTVNTFRLSSWVMLLTLAPKIYDHYKLSGEEEFCWAKLEVNGDIYTRKWIDSNKTPEQLELDAQNQICIYPMSIFMEKGVFNDLPEPIIHQGWLWKCSRKPTKVTLKKKRFFALKGQFLFYFSDENTGKAPKGVIDLEYYRCTDILQGNQEVFFRVEKMRRGFKDTNVDYILSSDNPDALVQWHEICLELTVPREYYAAAYEFMPTQALHDGLPELALRVGDFMECLQSRLDGWMKVRTPAGALGFVPTNFVEKLSDQESQKILMQMAYTTAMDIYEQM